MNRLSFYSTFFKQLIKINYGLLYGTWKVRRLFSPIVTIFGGTRFLQSHFYAQQAHRLTHKLGKAQISVITGGGPGIMEAASCAIAHEQIKKIQVRTLGITVRGLEPVNECVKNYMVTDQFFVRKWLMIHFSTAFAVFPGGFGTLDEFAEVITLMQTNALQKNPIILFGRNYWKPFIDWMNDSALAYGLISHDDLALLAITDDVDEAFHLLQKQCTNNKQKKQKKIHE